MVKILSTHYQYFTSTYLKALYSYKIKRGMFQPRIIFGLEKYILAEYTVFNF